MISRILLFLLASGFFYNAYSQNLQEHTYSKYIDVKDLTTIVYDLASPKMEGRKTGEKGQKLAADYIVNTFRKLGVAPLGNSYFQKFTLTKSSPFINQLELNGVPLKNGKDYLFEGEIDMKKSEKTDLIFLGIDPRETSDQIDLKGKAVAILYNENVTERLEVLDYLRDKGVSVITHIITKWDIVAYKKLGKGTGEIGAYLRSNETPPKQKGGFYIDLSTFSKAVGISPEELINPQIKEAHYFPIQYHIQRRNEIIDTENILGFIEGKSKKNEVVVISAHYDHEGVIKNEVYPGADDNASGVAAMLEVAQALHLATKEGELFEKSILFVAFSAEEDGILGSEYFVQNSPIPLENIIANLNIDMIGRIAPEYADYENYIYLVGSDKISKDLHKMSESANRTFTQLELDYTYNDTHHPDQIYYRSDQWSFAKNNIPAIFYFGGEHDDYSQPSDTPDKINYPILAKRTKLVFHTAWALISLDVNQKLDGTK